MEIDPFIFRLSIFILSIFIIGVTKLDALVMKTSSALYNCCLLNSFSFNFNFSFFIIFLRASFVTPFKISVFEGWLDTRN